MDKKILSILTAFCIAGVMTSCGNRNDSSPSAAETTEPATIAAEETTPETLAETTAVSTDEPVYMLEYWTENSPAAQSIQEYVADVSDESSGNYVSPAERTAVFDFDGTLFGELFPTYFDQCLLMHRLLHDDTYPDSEKNPEDKAYVEALENYLLEGAPKPDSSKSSGQMLAEAFKGYTVEEYKAYVREFMAQPVWGFEGMTYADAFYKPMVSLIRYLTENDFQVFICSGAERSMLREVTSDTLGEWIPPYHIIGTTFSLTAEKQGDTEGRDYTYAPDDKVLYEGNMVFKNVKANKVFAIVNEMGIAPLLSFGNSSGDTAMAQYVVQNGGKAFMLLCDDTERDYGSIEKAEKFAAECEALGFETISMKNDFATIYGENVYLADLLAEDQAA